MTAHGIWILLAGACMACSLSAADYNYRDYRRKGDRLVQQGKFAEALAAYRQAQKLAKRPGDKRDVAEKIQHVNGQISAIRNQFSDTLKRLNIAGRDPEKWPGAEQEFQKLLQDATLPPALKWSVYCTIFQVLAAQHHQLVHITPDAKRAQGKASLLMDYALQASKIPEFGDAQRQLALNQFYNYVVWCPSTRVRDCIAVAEAEFKSGRSSRQRACAALVQSTYHGGEYVKCLHYGDYYNRIRWGQGTPDEKRIMQSYMARSYLMLKRYDEAIARCHDVLAEKNRSEAWEVRWTRGTLLAAYEASGRFEELRKTCEEFLRLSDVPSERLVYYRRLFSVAAKQGDAKIIEQAAKNWRGAVITPEHAYEWADAYGSCLSQKKQHKQAFAVAGEALTFAKSTPPAVREKYLRKQLAEAEKLEDRKLIDSTIRKLAAATQRTSEAATARLRAQTYLRNNNLNAAVAELEKPGAADGTPAECGDCLLLQGELRARRKDAPEKIMKCYEDVLLIPKLPPDRRYTALNRIGILAYDQRRHDVAGKAFSALLHAAENDPRARPLIGGALPRFRIILIREKKYKQAYRRLSLCTESDYPGNIRYAALGSRAILCLLTKRPGDALADAQRMLKIQEQQKSGYDDALRLALEASFALRKSDLVEKYSAEIIKKGRTDWVRYLAYRTCYYAARREEKTAEKIIAPLDAGIQDAKLTPTLHGWLMLEKGRFLLGKRDLAQARSIAAELRKLKDPSPELKRSIAAWEKSLFAQSAKQAPVKR